MRSLLRLALIATLASAFGTSRNRFLSCFSIVAILLGAGAAQAGVLQSAVWSQVTAGFPMSRTSAQLGATGTSTANGNSIAVSLSYPQFMTSVFVPKSPQYPVNRWYSVYQGGAQALTATPSMALANQGVPGQVLVLSAIHNTKGVNQSTYMTGPNVLERWYINVGVDGQATGSFIFGGANHLTTVDFYGWTPGTLSFASLTSNGVALPSVVAMGSFNLDDAGAGTVTLVSPSKLTIVGPSVQRRTVGITTLELSFVPEPGTLVLLGAGVLGLALVRFRRG